MTEKLQTRTEHSRSLADAERYKAVEVLKEYGVLIPVADLEVYHGRVREPNETEPWIVDTKFRNGSNDSGNYNVNSVPTLYTGSEKEAIDFAEIRSERGRKGAIETHRIVASDNLDATIIDITPQHLKSLTDEAREAIKEAITKLNIPLTQGAPLEFEDRDKLQDFIDQNPTQILDSKEIHELAVSSGMGETSVRRLIGSSNARSLLAANPSVAVKKFLRGKGDFVDVSVNNKDTIVSTEYIQRFLKEANIVGVKQKIWSATLSREADIVSFFDLHQINTPEHIEHTHATTQRLLGSIASEYGGVISWEQYDSSAEPLLRTLGNLYATPRELVQASQKVKSFEDIFPMKTGVWEEYTLAEHTETVLRNLDENYTDHLPVALVPLMRLAIIGHDIGKPIAVAAGQRSRESEFNAQYAEKFYTTIGMNEKKRKLLSAIIGDGAKLMHEIYVKEDKSKISDLRELARRTMADFFDTDTPSLDQEKGFARLCRILQVCDGGAYTSMAVTNSQERRVNFRNSGTFNRSFREPTGPGKRDLDPITR